MRVRLLVAAVLLGAACAGTVTGSAEAVTYAHRGHVNSNRNTNLYKSPYGTDNYGSVNACLNFTWDVIVNGRYHTDIGDGWISTDRAGSGWC